MTAEKFVNSPYPNDRRTARTAIEDWPDRYRHKIPLKYGCGAATGFSLTCERENIHDYGTDHV
jgi:hypothetical protein